MVVDIRVTQGGYPGIGRATTGLVAALLRMDAGHEFRLLCQDGLSVPAAIAAALAPPHRLLHAGGALRVLADQWHAPRILRACRADLYHSPYYAQALWPGCPSVLTVFDLIPVLFPRLWPRPQGAIIRGWLRQAVRGAAHLVVPSRATAEDLQRLYGVQADALTVAPLAVDPAWLHVASTGVAPAERAYLLCVCTNKPHKNLPALVAAYGLLRERVSTAPDLVIAGGWDARYPEAKEVAARHAQDAERGRVRFLHDLDDRHLRALYAHALGFVYPSRYEGFGLTPLEAMTCGLPLAVSTTPAVTEVVGDAAITFPPDDMAAMATAMERLVSDAALRRRLGSAARDRSRCFSWQATAEATARAYERALAAR